MKKFKKLTAIVLVVMLMLSMCMTSLSVSAATTSDGTKVVYLKPNANWLKDGARFAIYTFGDGEAWTSMTDADKDGYYEVTVPKGNWTGIIFCRMSPSATANNWTNKWNQSADLTIPDNANCYTVAEGAWDKGAGSWSMYTPVTDPSDPSDPTVPTTPVETDPTDPPVKYDYTVAGDQALTGVNWDPTANGMTDEDGDGVYEITFTDVPV